MSFITPCLLGPLQKQRLRLIEAEMGRVPCPRDGERASSSGTDPDRVLIFGGGIAFGWGVCSQDLALPGQLARALTCRTGRGADVEVRASTFWSIDSAAKLLSDRDLRGYDAVVLVFGAIDAFRFLSVREWRRLLSEFLDILTEGLSPGAAVVLMGIQPPSTIPILRCRPGGATDAWAERLNAVSRSLQDSHHQVVYVDPPRAEPQAIFDNHRYRSPQRFHEWAEVQAEHLAPLLDAQAGAARVARNRPQPMEQRLATLERLGLVDSPPEKPLDLIVRRARLMMEARSAAFTLIDDHRQWNKAVSGAELGEIPLEQSFCRITVDQARPFVVGDAWADEAGPGTTSPIRFYAGYPVEAPDGTRIGALCVFDPEPREASTVDVTLLRDLALAIQRELVLRAVPA